MYFVAGLIIGIVIGLNKDYVISKSKEIIAKIKEYLKKKEETK
jgi:hypothetical protein